MTRARSTAVTLLIVVFQLLCASSLLAQSNSALAEFIEEGSVIKDRLWRQVEIKLNLSQQVPYRVYVQSSPNRVLLEFGSVNFQGFSDTKLLSSKRVRKAETSVLPNGWSRLSLELAKPFAVTSAEMKRDANTEKAILSIWLGPVTEEEFKNLVSPYNEEENYTVTAEAETKNGLSHAKRVRIVLDPGHGGEDPGALAGNLKESDLMLRLALEIKEALLRAEIFDVFLTRTDDRFVSLRDRVEFATEHQADLFISLHADAIDKGVAYGTTVYTLSEKASDELSETLAHEHDRASLLVGADLTGAEDTIADILIEMASTETLPRSEALAEGMIEELLFELGSVNAKPLRKAGFSVLKSPDIPSILVEVGFLSTQSDLDNLIDPIWRNKFVNGFRNALVKWVDKDTADAIRRRQ